MVNATENPDSFGRCPVCGHGSAYGTSEGLCLICLLRAGMEDPEEKSSGLEGGVMRTPAPLRFFGDYELLREAGRGGMSIVYEAHQFGTQRRIALKLLTAGAIATREAIHRFHTEAKAVALLEHPNIVPIYEAGVHEGQYFLAMRFLEGGTLAERAAVASLTPTRIAEIMKDIAAAVHFGHTRGVLHRDLKPTNILLDKSGNPCVSDFGLARIAAVDDRLTLSMSLLGTAAYIAPEVIKGGSADGSISSDVYGLGAILYELLAGQPPFPGTTFAETLRRALDEEPVPPSQISNPSRSTAPDLETVCLKCLEKDPLCRYPTAQDLADDLDRFLRDEPIHARPSGPLQRASRWCRRQPALALLGALAFALLLVVVVGAPIAILRIDRARGAAEASLFEAQRDRYAVDMRLASEALRNGDVEQVGNLLKKYEAGKEAQDLRGFEWRYLRQASDQRGLETGRFQGLPRKVFDPDLVVAGKTLYNFQSDVNRVLAWDMETWAPLSMTLPAARGSDRWRWHLWDQAALAIDDQHQTIALYRLPNFEELALLSVPGKTMQTAVSKDLGTVAVSFEEKTLPGVLLFDRVSNSGRWVLTQNPAAIVRIGFSPDCQVLMSARDDGQVELWSLSENQALRVPERDSSSPKEDWRRSPFFAPNSTLLFLNRGRERNALEVWDWSNGELSVPLPAQHGQLETFAFSPDGLFLATAVPGGVIALLDAKQPRHIGSLSANGARITCLSFSRSGRWLASGGHDRTAKVWDVRALRPLAVLGGHDDSVCSVAFTPDEESVITLSGTGKLRVWNLSALLGRDVVWRPPNAVSALVLSTNDRLLGTCDRMGDIHVWERATGRLVKRVPSGEPNLYSGSSDVCFSPTDPLLAWAGWSTLGILNYDTGETNLFSLAGRDGFCNPAFSPNGRELVFATAKTIMILDVKTRSRRPFAEISENAYGLAFAPGGTLLASAHDGGALRLWDCKSGRLISTSITHAPKAFGVQFSRDGRLLASGDSKGTAKLWEVLPTGLKLRHTLPGLGWVSVIFSPDGKRVVTTGSENALTLWDTDSGLEVGRIYYSAGFAGSVFSGDGNAIYSATTDGAVRIWPAPPLNPN